MSPTFFAGWPFETAESLPLPDLEQPGTVAPNAVAVSPVAVSRNRLRLVVFRFGENIAGRHAVSLIGMNKP